MLSSFCMLDADLSLIVGVATAEVYDMTIGGGVTNGSIQAQAWPIGPWTVGFVFVMVSRLTT